MKRYTVKKVDYGNGQLIYTEYKKPITTDFQKTQYQEGTIPPNYKDFKTYEQALQYMEERQKQNDQKSLRRAGEKIQDIMRANISSKSYFLTLTFADNITNGKIAIKHWLKFIRWFKTQFRYELRYLVVVEYQERGAIHYHCVIFNGKYIKDLQWLQEQWAQGAINYKKITDWSNPDKIATYLGGYLSIQKVEGKKYFTSRNIKKAQVSLSCDSEIDSFMEALQSPQNEVKTINKSHAYVSYVTCTK